MHSTLKSIFLALKPHLSHEKILCIKLATSIQRHTSHDPFYLFLFCSLCSSNQGSLLIGIHPISDQISPKVRKFSRCLNVNKTNIDAFNLVLSGLQWIFLHGINSNLKKNILSEGCITGIGMIFEGIYENELYFYQ